MDEPLSSAGHTRATSTALRCDSLRCEARLQPRFEVKICAPRRKGAADIVSTIDGPAFPPVCRTLHVTGGRRARPAGGRYASWLWVPSPGVPHVRTYLRKSCPKAACALEVGRCAKDPGEKAHPGRLNGLCDAPLTRYGTNARWACLRASRAKARALRPVLHIVPQHGARAVRKA